MGMLACIVHTIKAVYHIWYMLTYVLAFIATWYQVALLIVAINVDIQIHLKLLYSITIFTVWWYICIVKIRNAENRAFLKQISRRQHLSMGNVDKQWLILFLTKIRVCTCEAFFTWCVNAVVCCETYISARITIHHHGSRHRSLHDGDFWRDVMTEIINL